MQATIGDVRFPQKDETLTRRIDLNIGIILYSDELGGVWAQSDKGVHRVTDPVGLLIHAMKVARQEAFELAERYDLAETVWKDG